MSIPQIEPKIIAKEAITLIIVAVSHSILTILTSEYSISRKVFWLLKTRSMGNMMFDE